ncbi:hypothetical protein B0J12DRAFT_688678 [Macrophomina phaseolina]|uniref:Rhodopsin domain-containing protein n=1 Tax=Macrophomina phaseolina TaxID=35725 RepID=A0ABQ8FRL5_9PEZI|nr:hypothetical protein B0J12DRAFT_688678 [Macrophomina phaseolina]
MVDEGLVAVGVGLAISIAMFALRFYLRVIKGRCFTLLDFSLTFALAMEICFGAVQVKQYTLISAVQTPQNLVTLSKFTFANTFFYIACLWGVKLSVALLHNQVTSRIAYLHIWAVRTLYLVIFTWIVVYITYPLGCIPTSRKWEAPLGHVKACPPILKSWDFWLHLALHLSTDIWLCILPFPALMQIRERRLRVGVCAVYGLAVVSTIVSIVRAVLLGIQTESSLKHLSVLTMVEVTTIIVIGCLPGVSSTFTRGYVYHQNSTNQKSGKATRRLHNYYSRNPFSQLREVDREESYTKSSIELVPQAHATVLEEASMGGAASEASGEML